jgi:hypothetical protein
MCAEKSHFPVAFQGASHYEIFRSAQLSVSVNRRKVAGHSRPTAGALSGKAAKPHSTGFDEKRPSAVWQLFCLGALF